ncbi:bacteriorhodopsin [Halovenus marina]|uniref:bacteriorhodopsin n=1 Tax=Halovenus marina TaxID=3396621 RepID=UPI003F57353E
MATLETWFGLGAVGMLLGTLVLGYGSRYVPDRQRRRYALLVAVPLIAAVAYALMALGFGELTSQSGDPVFLPRYVDWLLTTPIHVLYLGLFAGVAMSTIYRSIALMGLTIAFGFAGAMLSGPLGWLGFLAGSVTFAGVVYYAYDDFEDAARGGGIESAARDGEAAGGIGGAALVTFQKHRSFLVVLWLVYPVIWALAPAGLGLMNVETTALVVSYLDVVAKVGFGLIGLTGYRSVSDTASQSTTSAD